MTACRLFIHNRAGCWEKMAIRDSLLAPMQINCFARIRKITSSEFHTYGKNGFAKTKDMQNSEINTK